MNRSHWFKLKGGGRQEKIAFATREEAEAHVRGYSQAYICPVCRSWHVGRAPSKLVSRRNPKLNIILLEMGGRWADRMRDSIKAENSGAAMSRIQAIKERVHGQA